MVKSHWAENFYNNFKNLYDADMADLNSNWHYHGSVKNIHDRGNNVYLLKTPLPQYTFDCMCGHAIVENCIVSNDKHSCVVGNCCVKKFMKVAKEDMEKSKTRKKESKKICRKIIKNHIKNIKHRTQLIESCGNKKPRFGKYKNKMWKDVPTPYIKWCVEKDIWFDYDIEQYIKYRIGTLSPPLSI